MEVVLAGLNWYTCLVYIDDVLLFSTNFEQHLERLSDVFKKLREAGMKLKAKKCNFVKKQVAFLGHVISNQGISPDPNKVAALTKMPVPGSKDQLKSFLGLASYYRKFASNFAEIAEPLHALLKKDKEFWWTELQQGAFDSLKVSLSSAPIRAYPEQRKPYFVHTDASGVGIGAVLTQTDGANAEHPVAFISRTLGRSERNYAAIEWEALAVVWAVKSFRHYLLGKPFTVITDHAPLRWLLSHVTAANKVGPGTTKV